MDNPSFSKRYGYEPLPEAMQLESLSDDLRREIWNVIWRFLKHRLSEYNSAYFDSEGIQFVERTIGALLKKPEDEIPNNVAKIFEYLKKFVLEDSFRKVLDFIEIAVNDPTGLQLASEYEKLFERYAAPYWLTTFGSEFIFAPRSNKEDGEAIQRALTTIEESNMKGTTTHLRHAIEHINAGKYSVAITHSIHAVESVARQIDPKANKTLGPALNSLEKTGVLKHPALKQAFQQLYGYTSDEQGIRHALWNKDTPNVGLDEALFMLGTCASFAAYLTKKHQQTKNQEGDST